MLQLSPDGWAAIAAFLGVAITAVVYLVRLGKRRGEIDNTVRTMADKTLPEIKQFLDDLVAEHTKLREELVANRAGDQALSSRVDRLEARRKAE